MRFLRGLGVVLVNLAVGLALIGAVVLITGIANSGIADRWLTATNWRATLPNYRNLPWAAQHFYEWDNLPLVFHSFLGWRRANFAGTTVHVIGDYHERRTAVPAHAGGKRVYFFGGSTMWGTGSDDDATIPSVAARELGFEARNFGETAYTAHQGLEMLIRLIEEGHRPDAVVFYDGVNDVAMKCRSDSGPFSAANESRLRERLGIEPGTAQYFLYPFGSEVARLLRPGPERGPRNQCDSDPAKARRVAEALISDWQIARMVAEEHGIRFFAFLQPVVYFSQTRITHIEKRLSDDQRRQYQAVYPIVLDLMKGTGFQSLVSALDADEYFYVDFCHLSPNGNQAVVRAMGALLQPAL